MALLLALPCLVALAATGAFLEDEMLSLSHAVAMGQGAHLYRDLFDFTGPWSHRLLAWMLALGAGPLATAHLGNALVLAVAMVLAQRSALVLGTGGLSATVAALGLPWALARVWPGWSHHWLVWCWALGALWLATRALQGRWGASAWPWVGAGALTAAAFLTVQPDGLVLLVALVSVLGIALAMRAFPLPEGLWRLAGLLAGFAFALGLEAAVLWQQGALWAAYRDAWLFPLQAYKQAGGMNDLPFASDLPARLLPYTGFPGWHARVFHLLGFYGLLVGGALGATTWGLGKLGGLVRFKQAPQPADLALALWALAAVGFWVVATRGRADLVHVATSLPPALVLAAVAASRLWGAAQGRPSWAARALAAWPGLLLVLWVLTGAGLWASQWRSEPGVWWPQAGPDATLQTHPSLRWLAQRLKPGDRLAVLPYGGVHHTYLAPQATRWSFMVPPEAGFHPKEDWEAYWAEVARVQPRFVVLSPWPWGGEAALATWTALLPPGYREVATLPPLHPGWGVPVHVYARP